MGVSLGLRVDAGSETAKTLSETAIPECSWET